MQQFRERAIELRAGHLAQRLVSSLDVNLTAQSGGPEEEEGVVALSCEILKVLPEVFVDAGSRFDPVGGQPGQSRNLGRARDGGLHERGEFRTFDFAEQMVGELLGQGTAYVPSEEGLKSLCNRMAVQVEKARQSLRLERDNAFDRGTFDGAKKPVHALGLCRDL